MGVYLPLGYATQGPCPDGFHVPTKDELQSLYNIWVALGGATSDFGIALKLPFAGRRNTNSKVYVQGSWGHYASAVLHWDDIYYLYFTSSDLNSPSASTATPTLGYSIRAFRNSPVVPTSSWTKMYGTSIKRGGIFRSSADGLISLSSNGNTWVTIQDKNLGATQVWNSGDTLSEANCGKYYQRGNNYGFPRTGSVTTSGKRVTISGYGPGNYYSSSTFITNSEGDPRWYNSSVDNLRGGVDGNVPTMSELKNAYIGEYVQPYLCFTANVANSTVKLVKVGSPTSVTLETSTDGANWSTYTFGNTITLSNVGDKVYWRNTSETDTGFSINGNSYYGFNFTGSVAGSGDITSLLNKNCTDTLSSYCFISLFSGRTNLTTPPDLPATNLATYCYQNMFYNCSGLTKAPSLPATTLTNYCYYQMFRGCTSLTELPNLPATTLTASCYYVMFYGCTNIKLSTTQTGDYQTEYRIPTTGTGTVGTNSLANMFAGTGGTFTGTPTIDTTYYTSNTVV